MQFGQLKRREFIMLLGGAAAWPLAARAQQPVMPVIGFLNSASAAEFASQLNALRGGLQEAGYIEGQNVAIEYRWANDQYDRLAALADDLVRRRVSVIVANTPGNLVAKAATSTIPIVFTSGGDPVQLGLVASLNRPGGNVTGVAQLTTEIVPKRLELLHELVPSASVMALLVSPADPSTDAVSQEMESAARKLGLQLHVLRAATEGDFGGLFANLIELRAGGLVIGTGTLFNNHSKQLAELALRHSVPAIFRLRRFVTAGGLASYGGSLTDSYRLAGGYVGRILNGKKPADLLVQQTTKFELIINLNTAKVLGITVPLIMQMTADEVIE